MRGAESNRGIKVLQTFDPETRNVAFLWASKLLSNAKRPLFVGTLGILQAIGLTPPQYQGL